MNFLLHRHLCHADTESAVAGIGAMLPDLWRIVDRRVRPAAAEVAWSALADDSIEARDVMRGIEHHLAADLWFHDAGVFTKGERATIEALRGARTAVKKLTLFAHPLWEMCLDGALVRRLGAGAVRSLTADGFALASAAIGAAARAHFFARVDGGEERARELDERMRRAFGELANGPWIEGYARPDGLVRGLAAMRRRFALAPFADDEAAAISAAIATLEARADAALDEILAYRPEPRPRAHLDQALARRSGAAGAT